MATQESTTTTDSGLPLKLSSFDECTQINPNAQIYDLLNDLEARHVVTVKALALLFDEDEQFVTVHSDFLWLIQRQIDEAKHLTRAIFRKVAEQA